MKYRILVIVLVMVMSGWALHAGQCVTFLNDGNVVNDNLIDMSSNTGNLEYASNLKIQRSRVWMVNFVSGDWDFPQERRQLNGNRDTIFLRDGGVLQANIIDFSSRRHIFEFKDGGNVHESNVMRIYFCCIQLPEAFKRQTGQDHGGDNNNDRSHNRNRSINTVTFLVNGDAIDTSLKYINSNKTGFSDGLQINTKDIWMINFEDDNADFPRDRGKIDRQLDTVFLTDGQVVVDTVVDFNLERGTVRFENIDAINVNQIRRIYFCCNSVQGHKNRGNKSDHHRKFSKDRRYEDDQE